MDWWQYTVVNCKLCRLDAKVRVNTHNSVGWYTNLVRPHNTLKNITDQIFGFCYLLPDWGCTWWRWVIFLIRWRWLYWPGLLNKCVTEGGCAMEPMLLQFSLHNKDHRTSLTIMCKIIYQYYEVQQDYTSTMITKYNLCISLKCKS